MDDLKAVLVSTEHKGVFFGYIPTSKEVNPIPDALTLFNSRMCIEWSCEVHGFMGLGKSGPDKNCRITPAVPETTVNKITSISICSKDAARAWEKEPWR